MVRAWNWHARGSSEVDVRFGQNYRIWLWLIWLGERTQHFRAKARGRTCFPMSFRGTSNSILRIARTACLCHAQMNHKSNACLSKRYRAEAEGQLHRSSTWRVAEQPGEVFVSSGGKRGGQLIGES